VHGLVEEKPGKLLMLDIRLFRYDIQKGIAHIHPFGMETCHHWKGVTDGKGKVYISNMNMLHRIDVAQQKVELTKANNYGIWSDKEATLELIIKPAIWETIWFRLGIVLLIVLTVVVIFHIRIRSINKQKKMLQENDHKIKKIAI
jgi:hypothetical protein